MTTPDSLHIYFQMLLRGEEEIRQSSMPKIALEMLLLRMAQLPRLESLDAVLDRIGELEGALRGQCPGQSPAGKGGQHGGTRPAARESRPTSGSSFSAPASRPPEVPKPAPPLGETHYSQPSQGLTQVPGPAAPEVTPKSSVPEAVGDEDDPPEPAWIMEEQPSDLSGSVAAFAKDPVDRPNPQDMGPDPVNGSSADPPVHPAKDSAPPARAAMDPETVVGRWAEFVRFLEYDHPMLWAMVAHCGVQVSPSGDLQLEVPEIYEKSTKKPEFLDQFGTASNAFFGCRFDWVIIKKESGPRGASDQKSGSGKPSGRPVANHPAVQQAIEILGAELVEVKAFRSSAPGAAKGKKKPA